MPTANGPRVTVAAILARARALRLRSYRAALRCLRVLGRRRFRAPPKIHIMKIKSFIIALAFASTAIADPPATKPAIDTERLPRVYANLKNAEQMATGGLATSPENLMTAARATKFDDLKKECVTTLDRTLVAISSAPSNRRPETMAYLKDAMLRLTVDREEPHAGHVGWAQANRDKVSTYIRNYSKTIKDGLFKL